MWNAQQCTLVLFLLTQWNNPGICQSNQPDFVFGAEHGFAQRPGSAYTVVEKREKFDHTLSPPPKTTLTNRQRPLDFSAFLDRTTLGTSVTFIWDDNNTEDRFLYQEWTWNLNAAVSITTDIDLGIAVLPIWTQVKGTPVRRHLLTGIFTQYDFLRYRRGNRLFLETGYYRGNLCTCGEDNAYYRPNLSYVPIGGGLEMRLFNSAFFLDLSFLAYNIVSKVEEDKWAYTQYVIGLNYHFYQ